MLVLLALLIRLGTLGGDDHAAVTPAVPPEATPYFSQAHGKVEVKHFRSRAFSFEVDVPLVKYGRGETSWRKLQDVAGGSFDSYLTWIPTNDGARICHWPRDECAGYNERYGVEVYKRWFVEDLEEASHCEVGDSLRRYGLSLYGNTAVLSRCSTRVGSGTRTIDDLVVYHGENIYRVFAENSHQRAFFARRFLESFRLLPEKNIDTG